MIAIHPRSQFLTGTIALALAATSTASAQSPAPKMRVGVTPTDLFSEAYYAVDNGFFQKAGLNVEVETFTSGTAASAALIGGSLQVGITTPLLLANGFLRNVPFAIIAPGPVNTPKSPQTLVCVSANGPIRSAKDLIGKTVGLNNLKTVLELSLNAWLDKNGVEPASVRRVEIVFSQMGAALERGTVDAALIAEPALTASLKGGSVRSIGDPNAEIAPRFLAAAWFTTRPYALANPELIKRFTDVIYETAKWANAHHEQSAPILAKYTKVSTDIIRSMIRAEFAEQLHVADIQPLLDAGVRYGFLAKPVNAADLLLHP